MPALQVTVVSVLAGMLLGGAGWCLLPALLVLAAAWLEARPGSTATRPSPAVCLLMGAGFALGLARTSTWEGAPARRQDPEQVHGAQPRTERRAAHRLPAVVRVTGWSRPTHEGWTAPAEVRGRESWLTGPHELPAPPLGSVVAASCRAARSGGASCRARPESDIWMPPGSMRAALHRARGEVISAFSRATTGQGGAAAAALATGASRVMAPVQRDRLARLGLLHLWAVSGLHLALVGGALLWILQRLQARLLPTRGRPAPGVLASLLALPFVAAYGVFAGAGPSVVRAGLAFGAYALLRLARRPARPATLLLAVVAVELGLATLELSSVGSLLSHSATAGILWAFCGRGERRTLGARRLLLPFRAALRAGVAASLATAAVQVAFFGSVAPFGIPAGALLVPLVGVVLLPLCLGAAATVLTGLAEIWDGPLALAAGAMDLVMGVLERVDRPGLRLTADPDLAPAVAAAAAVALWVWLKPRATGAVPARRRALLGAGALGALVLVPGMLPWGEAGATLLALDVGRGDAFLVRSATGSVALVDTGPGEPNGARSRVSPERLRRLGVSRVDLLVLTHRHADHAGGAHRLLRDLPVRRCVRPPTPRDSGINRRTRRFRKETPRVGEFRSETPGPPTPDAEEASLGGWAQLEEVLERVDLSCEAVQRGEILREGPFELRVLWPGPDAGGLMEENARSLMGRLSTGSGTIWISGDAGVAQEKLATAAVGEAERGGVLLVPHHGSSGSSSRSLLDNLAPVAAVASHGRPISRRVLARYRARGLPLCGTLAGGGARLELRGGRVLVPMACASVMMGFNPTERKKRRRLVLK